MENQDPKISLCMMVQDEEECIARALDNILPFVDEAIICDSGSTDGTLDIIQTYIEGTSEIAQTGTMPPIHVFHHPFEQDYSVHRNRIIEKATCKWIFILDSDETLDDDLKVSLKRLCANGFYDLYAFARRTRIDGRLQNIFNHDFHPRLFLNNGVIKYAGRIHESIVGHERMQLCNLCINHDKTSQWQQIDNERNWDMGQTPPPGWKKVDAQWQYFAPVTEQPHYIYPDKTRWAETEHRFQLTGFDDDTYRQWYNECMLPEAPPLELGQIGLSPKEILVSDEIERTRKGGTFLELGCGGGKFITSMLHRTIVNEGTAIDISDEMVKNARITAKNCGVEAIFIRSSIEHMPTDKQYDIVVTFDVLEHIFSLRDTLTHIQSVVNVGGMFAGSVPWLYTCDSPTHLHYFTLESLRNLLSEYFKNVVVQRIDLTGVPEYHLVFWGTRL